MGSLIDLEKFMEPDLVKRRKKVDAPDSGLDVSAWNAANPQHPKDARGRWTDNPVGRAIGQAYGEVRARGGYSEWVGLADLREVIGDRFSREEVDAELMRLRRSEASGGDPNVRVIPVANAKALSSREHAAALMGLDDRPLHAISIEGDLPAPKKADVARWTETPAGQAIAQAYRNVMASPEHPKGVEFVPLDRLRNEIGDEFSRAEVDAELKRLTRAQAILLVPESNQKMLTDAQRAAATRLGNEDQHLISFMGDPRLPAPKRAEEKPARRSDNDLGAARRSFSGLSSLDPFNPERVRERVAQERANLPGILGGHAKDLGEWDQGDLERAQKAAMEFSRATEMELFRRKGDALNSPKASKKPRATARLTAKPKPDLTGIGVALRQDTKRDTAHARLEGLTNADLRDLAAEFDVQVNRSYTKEQLKNTIVEQLVGFRAGHVAIMGGASREGTVDMDEARRAAGFNVPPAPAPAPAARTKRTPLERARENEQKISGRLGLAGDKRRRAGGGRIASTEETRLRGKLTEARNEVRRLEQEEREGKASAAAQAAAPKAPAAPEPKISALAQELRGLSSEQIEAKLRGLKVTELRALARLLSQDVPTVSTRGKRKADIQSDIAEGLAGFRERAAAIGGWGRGKA